MSLLILLVACTATPDAPGGTASGPPPALVEVARVRAGTLADTWSYLGNVEALERAELAAGAEGTLVRVAVREGDAVEPDQLLAEVDPRLALAQFEAARAEARRTEEQLAQAKRTLDRLDRVNAGVLAANELETAQSTVRTLTAASEAAVAARHVAYARLERHRVRAPFAGVVARRHVDPGDWVSPGTAVLDVVSTGAVEVRVEAPLALASRVHAGEDAQIQATSPVAATIVGVVPALDPVSRTAVIRLRPEAPSAELVAGTAVSVAFAIEQQGGVVVPRDAIVSGAVEERVFKVVESSAQPVVVTSLASSADQVLVASEGLSEGDRIVVRGNERLRPGQPVRLTE